MINCSKYHHSNHMKKSPILSHEIPRYVVVHAVNGCGCGCIWETDRVGCGWVGITEAQCLLQDCCYDVTSSTWCYYQAGETLIQDYENKGVWGKVMFLHPSVILFMGVSAPLHAGIHTSLVRHPPR